MTPFARAGRGPRPGFTLVELLCVISILGLLVGLIVAGAMKFREAGQRSVVDQQISRLQQGLNDEYQAVVEQAQKSTIPDAVLAFAEGDQDRARAIHVTANLRVNFPVTFAEATTGVTVNGYVYQPKATFRSVGSITGVPTDKQAAILLYLILTERSSRGGTAGVDSGTGAEQKTEVFGGKSLTYYVDTYGTPVPYFRWVDSSQSAEIGQPPYTPASAAANPDPLDPKGKVIGWANATSRAALNAAPNNLSFNGRNRVPSVVSYGKDAQFDSTFNPASDDRVGYRLNRFGNKGNGK